MRVLLINQFYWPDVAATAQMLTDLAEHLAQQGHEVHVLCSGGRYDHRSVPGGNGNGGREANAGAGHDDAGGETVTVAEAPAERTPRYESRAGVHIHRVRATGFGNYRLIGRITDYLSVHLLVGLRTLATGWRYDLIVTLTTPPLIGLYATVVKSLCGTRHVCWVMDLHPDCEFELGVFKRTSLLPRLADWLNGVHLRRADACVALGEQMRRRLLDKGVQDQRITAIPLWGHGVQGGATDPSDNPLRRQLGLEGRFVVMYSGNAGLIHTFDEVCKAAMTLRDDQRFVFLFVGGGPRLAQVQQFKEKHHLDNIQVRDYFPRDRLGESLALGDVHLVTLRAGMAGVAVPCKLYGILAAGRPLVFVGPASCESADAIAEAGCGVNIVNGDADALITALGELVDDPARCRRLGAAARAAYEQRYLPELGYRQWNDLLVGLTARRGEPAGQ